MDRRAAAEQQKQDRWLTMRQQLLREEEQRLQAVEAAEQATRALVKAVDEIIATNARMSALARDLSTDHKAPMALNPMELVSRMSSRIASVMMTIKGHSFRLGAITWPSAASGLYPANGPAWKDDEEQRMARALIGPLLQHGKA
jgi:Tfp pilus assembly protein PilX